MKVIVAQKGAREHYAAARALHQRGLLAGLATDWYAFGQSNGKPGISKTGSRLFGGHGRAAMAARCDEIPDGLVRAFPVRSLWWKWRVRAVGRRGSLYEGYAQSDAAFARALAKMSLPEHDVFFGYSYASLEMLELEKKRGVFTVLDQIDPGPVHFRIVAQEMTANPELAGTGPSFPVKYFDRLRREWELADVIVVNSLWSREAIVQEGADPTKIEVLPLAYEAEAGEQMDLRAAVPGGKGGRQAEKLQVLFLGQVSVPKGIHYLTKAARLLENEKVHFNVVGSIGILPAAVASAPGNMTFHGPVSRDRATAWYQGSDVFVLPTLSDGFALTQLEALAHGVPVIATPNCARVVEGGQTGFIVPARDAPALAESITQFVRNRNLSQEMAPKCRAAAAGFSIGAYGRRLVQIIEQAMKRACVK